MTRIDLLTPALAGLLAASSLAAQNETPAIPEDKDPVTTDSGLTYSVLAEGGEGRTPVRGDMVKVHYTGWLTDGKVFDSSRQRGEPAEFPVGWVIEGWNEALAMMTPGSRLKLTIPPDLGYGERGAPGTIPPNATLIFDVELLSVRPGPVFAEPDSETATTCESGLVYQEIAAGEGEPIDADTHVEMTFTIWTTDGKLIHDSANMGGSRLTQPKALRWGVLTEAAKTMRPGGEWLCRVPAALAFGDQGAGPDLPGGAESIWRVRMPRAFRRPEFSMPAEDKLQKTESGLQYVMLREGEGKSPKMGERVHVHYAGWLTDGTQFDASYDRAEPSSFSLGQVIAGWNEGLQLMKPGGAALLVIPGDLAYGASGRPPKIGPDATLVFHIELLRVGQ